MELPLPCIKPSVSCQWAGSTLVQVIAYCFTAEIENCLHNGCHIALALICWERHGYCGPDCMRDLYSDFVNHNNEFIVRGPAAPGLQGLLQTGPAGSGATEPCTLNFWYYSLFDEQISIENAGRSGCYNGKQGSFCVHVPSQWKTTLYCNVVSRWLCTYTKWSLQGCKGNMF